MLDAEELAGCVPCGHLAMSCQWDRWRRAVISSPCLSDLSAIISKTSPLTCLPGDRRGVVLVARFLHNRPSLICNYYHTGNAGLSSHSVHKSPPPRRSTTPCTLGNSHATALLPYLKAAGLPLSGLAVGPSTVSCFASLMGISHEMHGGRVWAATASHPWGVAVSDYHIGHFDG